jgi:hypothetical protein
MVGEGYNKFSRPEKKLKEKQLSPNCSGLAPAVKFVQVLPIGPLPITFFWKGKDQNNF